MSTHHQRAALTAVSSSAKQLFSLLRCISFSNKALVQILPQGIRFSVEEARVIQGIVFLEKSLFTTYQYDFQSPTSNTDGDDEDGLPVFQISLPTLIETLQVFGFNEASKDRFSRDGNYMSGGVDAFAANGAFSHSVLGISNTCRFSYAAPGDPLSITMEEGNATTTCDLSTYDPDDPSADTEDVVPFTRDAVVVKVIMQSAHLFDAISELSSTNPDRLTIAASASAPFFVLSATGPLGSASVEFSKDPQLLETFQISSARAANAYKFSLLRAATRAMALAAKVSLRVDAQGVLSLQFMIANEDGDGVSFVDFRLVPFLDDEEDGDGERDGGSASDADE